MLGRFLFGVWMSPAKYWSTGIVPALFTYLSTSAGIFSHLLSVCADDIWKTSPDSMLRYISCDSPAALVPLPSRLRSAGHWFFSGETYSGSYLNMPRSWPSRVRCLGRPRSTRLFDFAGRRPHELFLYSAPCPFRQWMQFTRQWRRCWMISQFFREDGPRMSRSLFAVLVSPEEYKKLDSFGIDSWL